MDDMMKLVIGWTIVGGFLFTTVITLLSLIGWVRFADARQQRKLFTVLVVELVVGAGAQVLGGARLDAREVAEEQKAAGSAEAILVAVDDMLDTEGTQRVQPEKEQLSRLLQRVQPKAGTEQATKVEQMRAEVAKLPPGKIDVSRARDIRIRIPPPPPKR